MLIFITFFILILNFHSLAHCSLISGWIKEGRHVSCPEKVLHGPQKPGHCYPRNMWSPQNRWVTVIPTRLTQHVTYEALSKQYHCWKYIRYLSLNLKSIFEAILLTLILFLLFWRSQFVYYKEARGTSARFHCWDKASSKEFLHFIRNSMFIGIENLRDYISGYFFKKYGEKMKR